MAGMFSASHRRTAGFTLLEMLVVMAIAGILLAIIGVTYQNNLRNAKSSDFIEALAQDINLARSTAMAKGRDVQVELTTASAYQVTSVNPVTNKVYTLASNANTSVLMSGFTAGDKIVCSSRGFCLAQSSSGAGTTINQISCTANGKTRVMSITVLGLTRMES